MKPKSFFVISEWNNDISWVKDYTEDYIIYDKSNTLPEDEKILKPKNVGFNIWDQFDFIVNHYNNLPKVVAFLEGNPFDHCKQETFDKLIYNETFTPIEDYSHVPEYFAHKKDLDGGYMEINNSWYLGLNDPKFEHRWYNSYNEFMMDIFEDYLPVSWVRFSPGGQYIVPRANILKYTLDFWDKLKGTVSYATLPLEAFMIERALFYIYSNKYTER
jgi:hypothetical protein